MNKKNLNSNNLIIKTIILVLFFFSLNIKVQSQSLYVREKNSSVTNIPLNNIQFLYFNSGNAHIKNKTGIILSFQLSNLRSIVFTPITELQIVNDHNDQIILYPNPVSDMLTIDTHLFNNKEVSVEILSFEGKLYYSKHFNISNNNLITVNISLLKSGAYFCRMNDNKIIITKKIIKI